MKWFFLLIGLCSHLFAGKFDDVTPSSPEEIASLNTQLIVGDFISALSGQLSISEIDLRIKATQDLIFKRIYLPPQVLGRYDDNDGKDKLALGADLMQLHAKGWITLPHIWAGYNSNSPYFQVVDSSGYVLEFYVTKNKGILKTSSYGCTNLKGEEPSSLADIRNIEFFLKGNEANIIWPNGTKRIYTQLLSGLYRLDKEILPNGKSIRYQYDDRGLCCIIATDISGKYLYASLKQVGYHHFKGSNGREVKLNYEARQVTGKFKKKKRREKTTFRFPVMTKASSPSYSNNVRYNDRALLTYYDSEKYPISASYIEQKGKLCKVQTLSTPSGSISFSYNPPIPGGKGGSTTVTYPTGAVAVYRFNSTLLLTAIENWLDGKLYNQKVFTYDHKQHIAKIETKDGHGDILLTKDYVCDKCGNPISETHIGDFGSFSIKRTFSKNRLISEIRDDGLKVEYTYLHDTHLPLSKTIFSNEVPLRKTIYVYDEAYNLIQEKEEGKKITCYELFQEGPHLHQTRFKIEKDWDGNLIHKTDYFYDQYGNVSKENHFGSDGNFAYSVQKKYDTKNNLIEELNPLGQKASYKYDERNRLIQETPFSNKLTISRDYDAKGRLVHLQENSHETHFAYNSSDKLIEKIDYLGLKTNYEYHPVHGKATLVKEGKTLTEISYDPFGREVLRKDTYGASTKTFYNSYGDPLKIIYPDKGVETFVYGTNGLLLEKIDPDGIKEEYSYDPLGRMLSKKIGSSKTTYIYDAYHLIQEIDPLAISTNYSYNLTGQKIKEDKAGRTTHFSYDSLGFLSKEQRSKRKILYKNDILGRVLKKNIDDTLKTIYTYDEAGNISSISKGSSVTFKYDPYNRLIAKTDEEGAKTTISYEEGEGFLIKKISDPRGTKKLETYNAHGLLTKREIPGALLEEFSYDNNLRLFSQDHLTFSYTPQGLQTSICEAGKRTTFWTYTPGGKIHSKQNPDGTLIFYDYDDNGRIKKIGYREFQYDALGRLTKGTGFKRELDAFGNIVKEELATGLVVKSQYDDWDRPTKRVLPDQSKIHYEYEGPFLKQVRRVSKDNKLLYTHIYESFDQKGNLLSETGAFTNFYSYDKVGRRINQKSPYFEEVLVYDLSGNLIKKGDRNFTYDKANRLTSEEDRYLVSYDQYHNCIKKNDQVILTDELNQREDLHHDLNGNLVRSGFIYDEFNQLIFDGTQENTYDAIGRRLSSGPVSYFYFDEEEIGSFEDGKIKELKVPGINSPIAIEIDNKPYAATIDVQNTIRQLVDFKSGELFIENDSDAFGCNINQNIPYAYMGKRYDSSTGFVYFGKRFYNPMSNRWITTDPLGPVDHSNLYQYVFNNPYRYYDPSGESIGGYLLGIGEIILGGTLIATAGVLELATCGGFSVGFGFQVGTGTALISDGLIRTSIEAQDIKFPNISWKNTNPFDGPVDGEIFVGDSNGNIIPVPDGHQIGGSKDGKCLEVKDGKNEPTGLRKDGKGHPQGPKHPDDPRSWKPHAHVPGVTNPDGTPWLPIYK